MAGIKELQEKIKNDSALSAKFQACKSLDDVVELASKEGFDISVEDIEKLTDISAADLAKAAGGARFIVSSNFKIIASPNKGMVC